MLMARKLNSKASRKIYERAAKYVTGGVHSSFRFQEPYPRYFARAKGPYVWDVDGNRFIDCIVNMGACILGHSNPKVLRSVRSQLNSGLTSGLETELGYKTAKLLSAMVPSAEVVKFSSTGTEAVMHAIQIARGYSGRNKIAKIEGGYSGWYDYALVSTHPRMEAAGPAQNPTAVPGSAGLAEDVPSQSVIIPFNDVENTTRIIREHKDELAAVIIEPVMFNIGCVEPKQGYLQAVRELTEELGIILIFDEVLSGFRLAPGGAQEYYGVTPDISTFGKAIANGFPFSAVVGRQEVMAVTDPQAGKVSYAGTYNANQIGLAASYATLSELKSGRIQRRLNEKSRWLVKEFDAAASSIGVEAICRSIAGMFQVYFTKIEPVDYRTASRTDPRKYRLFHREMIKSGVLMHSSASAHHGIAAAHSEKDLRQIMKGMESAIMKARPS